MLMFSSESFLLRYTTTLRMERPNFGVLACINPNLWDYTSWKLVSVSNMGNLASRGIRGFERVRVSQSQLSESL